MLIRNAEVGGETVDVQIEGDRITAIAPSLGASAHSDGSLDARGGALIPGLRDHHIHLMALAASLDSVPCGPPVVHSAEELATALRQAKATRGWLRGTRYFESVAGLLDRDQIDAMRRDVPIRIQHRSGVMWFLNSAAIDVLGLDAAGEGEIEGQGVAAVKVERDSAGRATGRLFRADRWLRDRLPPGPPPNLAAVGRLLAGLGVTHVTDCTASNSESEVALLRSAQSDGSLPQTLAMMGRRSLDAIRDPRFRIDAHKIMLDEPALPALDALVEDIRQAHAEDRCVAFHTVTRTEILFAIAALEVAGVCPGDRLEHASIAPDEVVASVARLGLTVVTQPNFVSERGDAYLEDVDASDQPNLYRVRGWLESGVALGFGTDAPFGEADPWAAMRAAVERRTPSGLRLGEAETVTPEIALRLFTGALGAHPGRATGPPGVAVGDVADLCLLDAPWSDVRESLNADQVVATYCRGDLAFRRST